VEAKGVEAKVVPTQIKLNALGLLLSHLVLQSTLKSCSVTLGGKSKKLIFHLLCVFGNCCGGTFIHLKKIEFFELKFLFKPFHLSGSLITPLNPSFTTFR
jgi:hypothetical protein